MAIGGAFPHSKWSPSPRQPPAGLDRHARTTLSQVQEVSEMKSRPRAHANSLTRLLRAYVGSPGYHDILVRVSWVLSSTLVRKVCPIALMSLFTMTLHTSVPILSTSRVLLSYPLYHTPPKLVACYPLYHPLKSTVNK